MSALDHILIGKYCGRSHAAVAEADRNYCSWVQNVVGKNPFEAWRLLFAKFDPRNDASAQQMIDTLDKAKWKCARLVDIPIKLVKWEALICKHNTRTSEDAVSAKSKRALFKNMLPDSVRHFLDFQPVFRPGLTYDVIKADVSIPMGT